MFVWDEPDLLASYKQAFRKGSLIEDWRRSFPEYLFCLLLFVVVFFLLTVVGYFTKDVLLPGCKDISSRYRTSIIFMLKLTGYTMGTCSLCSNLMDSYKNHLYFSCTGLTVLPCFNYCRDVWKFLIAMDNLKKERYNVPTAKGSYIAQIGYNEAKS